MYSARIYMAVLALGLALPAMADDATPLLIVRFGAQPVYFEQALKNAVSRALERLKTAAPRGSEYP